MSQIPNEIHTFLARGPSGTTTTLQPIIRMSRWAAVALKPIPADAHRGEATPTAPVGQKAVVLYQGNDACRGHGNQETRYELAPQLPLTLNRKSLSWN